eukprot:CAMPEP_0202088022 /NCGR_PEP_ID=MMETSP0964-20121228/37680_1 /ASSEMBLY_ACC=CAM_ASM_000500 /TAXON_ID=4773 /ORGANISM="Schizochytrium aggregatum, Strain ATCC28209" /LENGTH=54 /DNA_ID=CAMNT_0048656017 /DNA_START=100 /DNA_END=261 /DNA_ORIENTATION=+
MSADCRSDDALVTETGARPVGRSLALRAPGGRVDPAAISSLLAPSFPLDRARAS